MMEMSIERKRKREDNFSNTMNSFIFILRYQASHYTDPKNKSVIYLPAAGIFSVNLSLEIIFKRNPQSVQDVLNFKTNDAALFSSERFKDDKVVQAIKRKG